MINLIPNEEKKKMSKDFYFRLATMFFVMLGLSVLVTTIAIFPSYFLSSIEKKSIGVKLKSQESESVSLPNQDTLSIVEDLKNKLYLIESAQKDKSFFSQKVINQIVLEKIPDIKITEISYKNDPKTGAMINIAGLAKNRETLVLFRRALEDNPAFLKVDLPISNFVKGSNIRFNLSLIPL